MRELAAAEGVVDRVAFEVADAADSPGSGYDLIAYFDCLHDIGTWWRRRATPDR